MDKPLPNCRKVNVVIEVPNEMSNDALLEHLCKAIHEGNKDSLIELTVHVVDIQVEGKNKLI